MGFSPSYVDPRLLWHPNIPKPLHGVSPRVVMGDDWWNKTRKVVYLRNNYCCAACAVHKSEAQYFNHLEAHEDYVIDYEKFKMTINRIVPLCHLCHNHIHSGRLLALAAKGEIPWRKFWDVMRYGFDVLDREGLGYNPFAVSVCIEATKLDGNVGTPSWFEASLWQKINRDLLNSFGDEKDLVDNWSKWRMVLEGKEYPPVHKNYKDWMEFYSGPSVSGTTIVAKRKNTFLEDYIFNDRNNW